MIDNRTSDICKDLDGKRFKISEAVIGVNFCPAYKKDKSCEIYSKIKDNKIEVIKANIY